MLFIKPYLIKYLLFYNYNYYKISVIHLGIYIIEYIYSKYNKDELFFK